LRAALGRDLFLLRTNQIEARQLARMMDVDPDDQNGLAQALVASGAAEAVIIALGADGMLLAQTDGVLQIRPPPVDIASPVGAGDSFVGALCFALGAEWPLERACAYGVAAAAAALMTEATELAHKADVERLFAVIEGCVERL
jgi:6-phosphofructokinase 2